VRFNVKRFVVTNVVSVLEKSLSQIKVHSGRVEVAQTFRLGSLLEQVKAVPGHVAELGVGAGTNALILSVLIKDVFRWDNTQYVGFDTFTGYPQDTLKRNPSFDQEAFSAENCSFSHVQERVRSAGLADTCLLIQGDVRQMVPSLVQHPPSSLLASPAGLRFRLLYIDCNDSDAATVALSAFDGVLSPGALVVIDERRLGGETRALMAFAEKNRESYQLIENPGFPGRICLTKVC